MSINIPCAYLTQHSFLTKQEADFYLESLSVLPYEQGILQSGKRENRLSCFFDIRAKQVWESGDNSHLPVYVYAGKKNPALPFSDDLLQLKEKAEAVIAADIDRINRENPSAGLRKPIFNTCLANYYEDGNRNIGLHSDSEQSLIQGSYIASISLGAERWFDIEAIFAGSAGKTKMEIDAINSGNIELAEKLSKLGIDDIKRRLFMPHGSMIVMGGDMQKYYMHGVPIQKRIKTKEGYIKTPPRINLTFREAK